MAASDHVYIVVGSASAGADDEPQLIEKLIEYDRASREAPGCAMSAVTRDLVKSDTFRIQQEWTSKAQFLAFQRTCAAPEDLRMTFYESSPFTAVGLDKQPHVSWAKSERKDLTKTQGKLFFLSKDGRTAHALFNNTPDLQFEVSMRFPNQQMKAASGVATEGEMFKATVFPSQTLPFVTGKWNGGYALSYSYGPVTDAAYLEGIAKKMLAKTAQESAEFKEFLKANQVNVDKPGVLQDAGFEERAVGLALQHGRPYVDLTWPPQQTSVTRPFEGKRRLLGWMRPEEYLPPHLRSKVDHIINTIEPGDIDQGALGDCWFLAAVAACTEWPDQLVKPIFHHTAKMAEDTDGYHAEHRREVDLGVFRVKFCKHGWWQWHVVDSYLPVQPLLEPGGPCFAKNKQEPSEMWVAMIEKAYAKVHGSYAAISGGDPAVAISDLTGFPTVSFDWKDPNLFAKILHHDEHGRVLWCSTPGEDASDYMGGGVSDNAKRKAQKYEEVGLGTGHAYTILKAVEVTVERNGKNLLIQLCQIRNPWGGAKEWNREWSDNSPEWREYPEVMEFIKQKWDIATPEQMFQADGSFWMSWSSIMNYFNAGGVCLRQVGWQDVRYRTGFEDGNPQHVFKIMPTVNCQCIAFAVQHDRRGLHRDDPRKEMCALRVEIVTPSAKKPLYDTVAQSNNGVFMYAHQVVAFATSAMESPVTLEAGREYYVLLRQHPGEQKVDVRNRDGITLCIQTSKGPRNQHCRGIAPLVATPQIIESWKYVGYYDMSDDGATVDHEVPCQLNGEAVSPNDLIGEGR